MNKCKLSIIVPVYGVEKYIDKCLNSLVKQSLKEIEVIVVNDGTKDNSQKIIDKYVKKYPDKIKSYIKENGGQGSARNYGLKKATGEYIGYVDSDDFVEKDRSRGIYFTQDWVSLPGVLPVASGGIHVWHMPALTEIFGDDSVLQFGGGTLGHPWGNAPGAVANRVALEACVQARNEGRNLAREGNEIIREASKWSPELAAACEVWKEIKFEFPAMDTL